MTYGHKGTQAEAMLYKAGFCVEGCNRRHSAGRPRCNECHDEMLRERIATDGQA